MSLVVFCSNFSTLQQKPHDYICSGCKNMVSQKMYGLYWATLYIFIMKKVLKAHLKTLKTLQRK